MTAMYNSQTADRQTPSHANQVGYRHSVWQ